MKLLSSLGRKVLPCAISALCFLISGHLAAQNSVMLVGTGSSLPAPLYNAWTDSFSRQHAHIHVRYLPVGTSESVHKIITGIGDFGGGDAPIPEETLIKSKVSLVELPTVLIGIVVVYHVSGVPSNIKLTGPALADIFLGKIKKWNDPQIVKTNPGVKFPPLVISVVHRTDGKGSNYIFSDYLSKISRDFESKAGRGTSPKCPVGTAASRSEEMVDRVKKTPGAIGYTEHNWAVTSGLAMAQIRNASGEFVSASPKTIAEAATANENEMTEDFRISLTNAAGKLSYPISSFTWLYVPAKGPDPSRTKALISFLDWALTNGQELAAAKGYAALPAGVAAKVRLKISTLQ